MIMRITWGSLSEHVGRIRAGVQGDPRGQRSQRAPGRWLARDVNDPMVASPSVYGNDRRPAGLRA